MNPEAQLPPALPAVQPTKAELANASPRVRKSANWFWWIAGLSVVNSVSAHMEGGMHFVLGLGFTQVADAFFHRLQPVAYVFDVGAVGFFAAMAYFARKGHVWAFLVGGIVYALDAAIYVYFQDWMPVAFHAYALVWIFQGFAELRRLNALSKSNGFTASGA